jgi:hypothetical protein
LLSGTASILGTNFGSNLETYTQSTSVPTTSAIWGVEYEPVSFDAVNNKFVVNEIYYTGPASGTGNWDVYMSITPFAAPPPGGQWDLEYTLHYSYQ